MSLSLSEYTKVDVSWDIGGTHSAPPSPLAGFKGLLRRRTRMEGRSSGWKGRTSEEEKGEAEGKLEENEGAGTREGGIAS